MIAAQTFWLAIVCLLGAWWARLVLSQAGRIAELERAAGLPLHLTQDQIQRTQRMLFWEAGTYAVLLLATTFLVFWIYWRNALRDRGVQAFFASVTHELRTPLTSIRLQAESIAESLSGDAALKTLVSRLLEDTMRLEGQVERTLELARVEGGGPVFVESVELKPWLARLVSHWREVYSERLQIDAVIEDVTILADPNALQVVMKNLLENSFRHAKREKLQVSLKVEAPKTKEAMIVIRYKDNGPVFEGDVRKLGKIFEKGAGSQGAGVGLYLIRVLMEQMGGSVLFNRGQGFETELCFKGGGSHG